ncbi:MAG: alanine--tRNA ligase [Patescibacteria group bacterium]
MLTANEIRRQFLEFFRARGHEIVPSASTIPWSDPTLMFTNAGMNQFKDVFLGTGSRAYVRAADSQKCIRAGGKHNDLEEVGYDTYHHTFFEMLGNWSFGDYYKREAIAWAWELLTGVWGLPKDALYATVHHTDDEAEKLWREVTEIDPAHVMRFGDKDNFWEMGETGPCGPCSEIHIDLGPDRCDKMNIPGHACGVNGGCARYIELWNLVFIQYNRRGDGSLEELPAKHVDTGMGFERICRVLQGVDSNYDIDLFRELIGAIERLVGRRYDEPGNQVAFRAIADHLRTLAFAIADGALPSNEGRGYVLRRILRRAARFGRRLGQDQPFLYRLVPDLGCVMGGAYPELIARGEHCANVIRAEEEGFGRTLDRGIELFEEIAADLAKTGGKTIPGAEAFKLYDTYGFPLDLTQLMAREKGLAVDTEGFERAMREQRERARAAGRFGQAEIVWRELAECGETAFTGYESLEEKSRLVRVGESDDQYHLVFDRTPFYAESGGQAGDTGCLEVDGRILTVADTRKAGNYVVHLVGREAELPSGTVWTLKVDRERRRRTAANHTATHLLQAALRQVLGGHVNQSGSHVTPERLRFDFTHFEKVTPAQLAKVEKLVNGWIGGAYDLDIREMAHADAVAGGATALFGEKYGDVVRVVGIGEFSKELCGGTHLKNTAEARYFRIVSESSVATGVRRIEALTGDAAIELAESERALVGTIAETLQVSRDATAARVAALAEEVENLRRAAGKAEREAAGGKVDELEIKSLPGGKYVVGRLDGLSMELLREAADKLRDKMGSGVAILGAVTDGRPLFVVGVTKDLTARVKAGDLIREIAAVAGGSGGGRPDFAQAGGKDAGKIDEALGKGGEIIKQALG